MNKNPFMIIITICVIWLTYTVVTDSNRSHEPTTQQLLDAHRQALENLAGVQ